MDPGASFATAVARARTKHSLILCGGLDMCLCALRTLLQHVPQEGLSALHHAARFSHLEALRLLLRHGARVNQTDKVMHAGAGYSQQAGTVQKVACSQLHRT